MKKKDRLGDSPITDAQKSSIYQQIVELEAQNLRAQRLQREHERLVGPFYATTQLSAALASVSKVGVLADFVSGLDRVAKSFAIFSAAPEAIAQSPAWLLGTPPLLTYTGLRAASAIVGLDSELIEAETDAASEEELSELRDALAGRLLAVHSSLAEAYQGALAAMDRKGPDWVRHVSVSLRQLLTSLIDTLAPTAEMNFWKIRTAEDTAEGGWSRRAKLRFIFREGRTTGTERMVDNIIDSTLMLIYPTSDGVHALVPPHNEAGMEYIVSHMQGVIATVLTAAEH
jgi:hypothetical protein